MYWFKNLVFFISWLWSLPLSNVKCKAVSMGKIAPSNDCKLFLLTFLEESLLCWHQSKLPWIHHLASTYSQHPWKTIVGENLLTWIEFSWTREICQSWFLMLSKITVDQTWDSCNKLSSVLFAAWQRTLCCRLHHTRRDQTVCLAVILLVLANAFHVWYCLWNHGS